MSMMDKQITKEDAVGKTVKHVCVESADVLIFFTDDTWLHVAHLYDEYGETWLNDFPEVGKLTDPRTLAATGLISQSEYDKMLEPERIEQERREREQYKRLKAKFEA